MLRAAAATTTLLPSSLANSARSLPTRVSAFSRNLSRLSIKTRLGWFSFAASNVSSIAVAWFLGWVSRLSRCTSFQGPSASRSRSMLLPVPSGPWNRKVVGPRRCWSGRADAAFEKKKRLLLIVEMCSERPPMPSFLSLRISETGLGFSTD